MDISKAFGLGITVRITRGRLTQGVAILLLSGVAGGLLYFYFANRLPPLPNRPLRIGFEPNPPFQIRTETGFGGLAIETINEAAKRAGLQLEWVETGTSSYEAFQKGLVDLWPLMTDLPERHRQVYFSRPWVISSHILVLRAGSPYVEPTFTGRIGVFKLPLHISLVRREFPEAQPVPLNDSREVLRAVCSGAAFGGFLERRVAVTALKDKPAECASTPIRMQPLPDLALKASVASTFETARAAVLLRDAIGTLFRDGSLAVMMAKYSFYGLDDAWSTYDMMQAAERSRWMAWSFAALSVAVLLVLWQTLSLRQRKQAERVLRDSEERFRAFFQQAGVGVAQIGLDGKVVTANDRYCAVVGHGRRDLVGRATIEITHKANLQEDLAMLPRLLSGEIQSFSTEKRYEREDGSVIWAEMCKSLVRDMDGHPKCFIAVVEDITERKNAEAALKESEKRFRNMADSAPVLIWVSGPDKLCTFFNKSWLEFTGRTMEQELGEGWAQSVHPDDLERCLSIYHSSFEARRDFKMEYRLQRHDGEYRWVIDQGVARFSSDKMFAGYIGCCIDITELKQNYEQHLATQKLESLGVLAAGVAHDFNNLLGAIVARAESALGDLNPGSPATEDVDQIRVTSLRAAEIVSQLMSFARQEIAPLVSVDLSSLVAEMLEFLKVSIAKTAALQTNLAPDLPLANVNAAEIRQVVMNLILNASEALEGRAGSITITTARVSLDSTPGDAVRLEVEDTGCGMTEAVKARIFDPFFTTRFTGRGLGLSAVQGAVRRHGGSITVDSTPGKGSRFTVILPCAAGEAAAAEPAAAPSISAGKQGAKVLFVEDEDSLRNVIVKVLRKKNFLVVEAANGTDAIECLKSDPAGIGVVLLDVALPGISGGELLDELYRIRPGIKVILSTAYSRETASSTFAGREFWGFIRKPYRTADLVTLLRQAEGRSGTFAETVHLAAIQR